MDENEITVTVRQVSHNPDFYDVFVNGVLRADTMLTRERMREEVAAAFDDHFFI